MLIIRLHDISTACIVLVNLFVLAAHEELVLQFGFGIELDTKGDALARIARNTFSSLRVPQLEGSRDGWKWMEIRWIS